MQKTNFKIKNEQMYVCIKAINSDIYEKLENCPFPFPGITKDNSLEYIIILVFFSFPSLDNRPWMFFSVSTYRYVVVAESCLFCDPMDSSLPGSSSVHGISQARILEWVEEYRFLLQGIFLTQGSNTCLRHWQADSLPLSHQGSPTYHLYHRFHVQMS